MMEKFNGGDGPKVERASGRTRVVTAGPLAAAKRLRALKRKLGTMYRHSMELIDREIEQMVA